MKIALAIIVQDKIKNFVLQENEKISIGSSAKDAVFVKGMSASQISLRNINDQIQLVPKSPFKPKTFLERGEMLIIVENPQVIAFISYVEPGDRVEVELPEEQWITLGRKADSDLFVCSSFVSKKHVCFQKAGEDINFRDEGSKNGVYLNGQLEQEGTLKEGDTLHILTISIFNEGGTLIFSNIGDCLTNQIALVEEEPEPELIEEKREEINRIEGYPYITADYMLTKKIQQMFVFCNLEYRFDEEDIYSEQEYKKLKECGRQCLVNAYHYYENGKHTIHYLSNRYRALSNIEHIILPHEILKIYCNIFYEVYDMKKDHILNTHKINWNATSIYVNTKTLYTYFIYVPIEDENIDDNVDAIQYLRVQLYDFILKRFKKDSSMESVLEALKNQEISVEQLIEHLQEVSQRLECSTNKEPLYLRDKESTKAFYQAE